MTTPIDELRALAEKMGQQRPGVRHARALDAILSRMGGARVMYGPDLRGPVFNPGGCGDRPAPGDHAYLVIEMKETP